MLIVTTVLILAVMGAAVVTTLDGGGPGRSRRWPPLLIGVSACALAGAFVVAVVQAVPG